MTSIQKILPCLVALAALPVLLCGCIEQKLTITSDPPGMVVRVSDEEVGTTPVTIEWVHPGEYEFILSRPGYQTKVATAELRPQWYQWPVIDLFAAISPYRHVDHRYVHFEMEKLVLPEDAELVSQGLEMREETAKPE